MKGSSFRIAQSFCCFERLILGALQAHSSGVNNQEIHILPLRRSLFPLSLSPSSLCSMAAKQQFFARANSVRLHLSKVSGLAHISMPNPVVLPLVYNAFGFATWLRPQNPEVRWNSVHSSSSSVLTDSKLQFPRSVQFPNQIRTERGKPKLD